MAWFQKRRLNDRETEILIQICSEFNELWNYVNENKLEDYNAKLESFRKLLSYVDGIYGKKKYPGVVMNNAINGLANVFFIRMSLNQMSATEESQFVKPEERLNYLKAYNRKLKSWLPMSLRRIRKAQDVLRKAIAYGV